MPCWQHQRCQTLSVLARKFLPVKSLAGNHPDGKSEPGCSSFGPEHRKLMVKHAERPVKLRQEIPETDTHRKPHSSLSQRRNYCLNGKITVLFWGTSLTLTLVLHRFRGEKSLAKILLKGGVVGFLKQSCTNVFWERKS
jgi:hypothetical protein